MRRVADSNVVVYHTRRVVANMLQKDHSALTIL